MLDNNIELKADNEESDLDYNNDNSEVFLREGYVETDQMNQEEKVKYEED